MGGKGAASIDGAVDQSDDFDLGVGVIGLGVETAPGAGASGNGDAVFGLGSIGNSHASPKLFRHPGIGHRARAGEH